MRISLWRRPAALALAASTTLLLSCNSASDSQPEVIETIASLAKPIIWKNLDGACFMMGEDRANPEEGPVFEACVEGFAIAAHEITNAQFAQFVLDTGYQTQAETGRHDPLSGQELPKGSLMFTGQSHGQMLDWWRFEPEANWLWPDGVNALTLDDADKPVVHVTLKDAQAFAEWAEARLPSEVEWEFAARAGNDRALFGWMDVENADLTRLANTWQGVFPVKDTGEDGHKGAAPVGSFPANDFGLFDMMGNVWELTSSAYYPNHAPGDLTDEFEQGFDPKQPGTAVNVAKGGSYLCHSQYCARYRPASRIPQDILLSTSNMGFRLVRGSVADRD